MPESGKEQEIQRECLIFKEDPVKSFKSVHINRRGEIKNERQRLPIDHRQLIDGFAELQHHVNYQAYRSFCGICDSQILVTAAIQKHLLEKKKIPVKFLRRGAVYCQTCKDRRVRINFLRKGDHFRAVEGGLDELKRLQAEELEEERKSKQRFHSDEWPY